MKKTGPAVLLFALSVVGCVNGPTAVKYESLVDVTLSPRNENSVELFQTQKPSRPYQEIGVLTYRAGTAETVVEVGRFFRAKAAELGADGVIMMGTAGGASVRINANVSAQLTDYQAMAIRFTN